MKTKQYRLTKAEKTLLERIQERGNDSVCNLMATKMYREHMNVHRGEWWVDDEFPEGEGSAHVNPSGPRPNSKIRMARLSSLDTT